MLPLGGILNRANFSLMCRRYHQYKVTAPHMAQDQLHARCLEPNPHLALIVEGTAQSTYIQVDVLR